MANEESEFSWGGGLHPPLNRGGTLSAYDRLRATRMTDPDNPDASEDDVWSPTVTTSHGASEIEVGPEGTGPELGEWVPGTLRAGTTQAVTETEPSSTSGQHKKIYSDRYNGPRNGRPAHDPEGYQDGAGAEWRNSIPPNPVL